MSRPACRSRRRRGGRGAAGVRSSAAARCRWSCRPATLVRAKGVTILLGTDCSISAHRHSPCAGLEAGRRCPSRRARRERAAVVQTSACSKATRVRVIAQVESPADFGYRVAEWRALFDVAGSATARCWPGGQSELLCGADASCSRASPMFVAAVLCGAPQGRRFAALTVPTVEHEFRTVAHAQVVASADDPPKESLRTLALCGRSQTGNDR